MADAVATPPAGPTKAELKAKAKAERDASKQVANGVTRPKDGTQTGRIWAISDEFSRSHPGKPAERKEVLEKAASEGLNDATAATQYGRWRKYHGLKAEPRAVAAPKTSDVTTQASPA